MSCRLPREVDWRRTYWTTSQSVHDITAYTVHFSISWKENNYVRFAVVKTVPIPSDLVLVSFLSQRSFPDVIVTL